MSKVALTQQMAKIAGMRRQCIEARGKIDAAQEQLHADTEDDIDVMARLAQRGRQGAESAYVGLAHNRGALNSVASDA